MSVFQRFRKENGDSNIPLIATFTVLIVVVLMIIASAVVFNLTEQSIRSCYESGGKHVDGGWTSQCVYPEK